MHWPGIAVELGGECETHAAAVAQVGDLLERQRLDRALLEAGIGRRDVARVLRPGRGGHGESKQSEEDALHHRVAPVLAADDRRPLDYRVTDAATTPVAGCAWPACSAALIRGRRRIAPASTDTSRSVAAGEPQS